MNCPNCGSDKIRLNGKRYDGKQRAFCLSCKKPFVEGQEIQPEKTYSFKEENGKAEINTVVNEEIKSLDDLIRVCKIDVNIWIVDRWECSSWGSLSKPVRYEGKERQSDISVINTLFRVKVYLKRNQPLIEMNSIKEEMINEIKKHKPKHTQIKYRKDAEPYLYEIDPFDIHFGKHAWGKETGIDYDIDIAEADTLRCIEEHINRAKLFNVERFLFPVGNDFFNVDNKGNTTANGTPQQEDTRWKKTFKQGRQLIVKCIDMLSMIAPVDVPVIPGNHDTERAFYLGDSLECWYNNSKNVFVDNLPKSRKYYQYGKCLVGFAHGKDEKIEDLPTVMAIEEPERFSKTLFREWHLGDKHHKKRIDTISIDEKRGVTTRILRSISPADSWHFNKGYIGSLRAMEGFLWHKEKGLVGQFSANL